MSPLRRLGRSAGCGARRAVPIGLLAVAALAGTSCAPDGVLFSETNARSHLRMLADTIGSRPTGTPANDEARAYLVDRLRLFGFEVRVQEAEAADAERGLTARVANIIAVRQGARDEAVGLVAHYDSRADTPGAGDDGLGTAVALEAARVLAARSDRRWSLLVLLTDGEELGLMGARALVSDPTVRDRLKVYLNLEATGADSPAPLFETGPGNRWLVDVWARQAAEPRGGSYGFEIYRRLPNDTDFSVLRATGAPGLNFAAVGDSYAYHTARDTADRVTRDVIVEMGDNAVSVVEALDREDITRWSAPQPRYFDLAGIRGVTYTPTTGLALLAAALFAAALAEWRLLRRVRATIGLGRLLLTAVWVVIGGALVVAVMVAQPWALRLSREVHHPWYAHPWRLFVLIGLAGGATGWVLSRLGGRLPARVRGSDDPVVVWSLTLPVWAVLATVTERVAPGAAYLWTLPLLVAGVLLLVAPLGGRLAVRFCSVLVLTGVAVWWLRELVDLLSFLVALMGRLPLVTPVFVYPAVVAVAGLVFVPPLVAIMSGIGRRLLPSKAGTAAWLLALTIAAALAYVAPAYTAERPLRRSARYVHDGATGRAFWEVGGTEPGLDLVPPSPPGWTVAAGQPPPGFPVPPLRAPFVFRSATFAGAAPFGTATARLVRAEGDRLELEVAASPRDPGTTVVFALPPSVVPLRASLAGRVRDGWWQAAFRGTSTDGVTLRAVLPAAAADPVAGGAVIFQTPVLPGGDGWQHLPPWLPQEHAVWSATAVSIVPLSAVLAEASPELESGTTIRSEP